MPGCGKSTIGKELAQRLQYRFLDLDTYLEEQEGLTVPEVFEQRGQEYFRQAEAQALRRAAALAEPLVVATGGGAPCFWENMSFMVSHGTSIYLKLSPSELASRLTDFDLHARPLLRDKTPGQLLMYLSDTLTLREKFYGQATFTVAAGTSSVTDLTLRIEQWLWAAPGQIGTVSG